MFDLDLMRRLSSAAAVSEAEVEQLRQSREEAGEGAASFEGADASAPEAVSLSDADVAALISPEARDLVIGFEVGSRQLYDRKYTHPEWPKGASGVTIGIGYDLGYNIASDVQKHWGGLISAADLQLLLRAVGVKGQNAGAILPNFRAVTVPWDAAISAYERSTMPAYGRMVLKAFPNVLDLHGHAFGALFSLVFNRGAGMRDNKPGDRKEMRNIREACIARNFAAVPGEIRSMKRIWEGQGLTGLLKRREAEAVLFESGLAQAVAAASTTAAAGARAESLGDTSTFDGDGLYADEDEVALAGREAAGTLWDDVKWPASDDAAPDYQHITNRSLSKSTFEFGPQALELLIKANSFEPLRDHGRIVFALRGAELVTALTNPDVMQRQQDRPFLTLRDCRPNHKNFRCIIGVYDLTTGRLSGFASSTVPNRGAVAGYYANQQAGNMMPAGCYGFEVNWHLASKPDRKIPGCLVENGRQKCVQRSINNMSYDVEDLWENSRLHGDNLHPAKKSSSAEFSSLGCLVVSGNYECNDGNRERGTHTGEWALFRKALGLVKPGTGDHGLVFDVVLLTGLEAAIASNLVKTGADRNETLVQELLGRIRYGSKGERVRRLQSKLLTPVTGTFNHSLLKAWTDRQRKDFANKSQGTYGPAGDAHYKFGVFDPLPAIVAANTRDTGMRAETISGGENANLEQLYYEIGLHAEAARRNPSSNTSSLESLAGSNLESINLEFGFAALKSAGSNIVLGLERQLQQRICADPLGNVIGREEIRNKIDAAAQKGVDALKRQLASALTGLVTGVPFVSSNFAEKIVDALFERLLRPAAGGLPTVITGQMELSAQWLCQRWCDRLGTPIASVSNTANASQTTAGAVMAGAAIAGTQSTSASNTTGKPIETPPQVTPAGAVPPGSAALAPTLDHAPVAQLLGLIEQAASGTAPDSAGVRRYIRDLRSHLNKSGDHLGDAETSRLLAALCDTPFMEQLPGVIGGDPYGLMRDVEKAFKKNPPDKVAAKKLIAELHALLGDARLKLQPQEVKRFLNLLRGKKLFEELSWMSDRFVARDPDLLGIVTTSYAQGLIDSGRLIAGIEMLHAAEDLKTLSADDVKDASGILGRAHKQIYVNHIKTASDAAALRDSFGTHIAKSAECYGRYYDPQRPDENWYQGINYLAVLKRAQRDGTPVQAKGDPDAIARGMIEALEPQAVADVKDAWLLATVGEAYLALGRYDKAAEYLGLYTKHPDVDAFALNGTIRQLEEVWQLQAGADGPGAILTNLKGALARMENGFVSLSGEERRAIAKAGSVEFQQYFESVTTGGRFINFGLLKRIVACGASVAAIQVVQGQSGRTIGTGFLVKGSDFSSTLSGDKSYILTNAHVMWDPNRNEGYEDMAVSPESARVVFENDQIDGRMDAYRCRVIWQSPSSQLDATLIELDRRVDHTAPLEVAPPACPLCLASETTKGTKLAVLGHPQGGNLSLGVLGSLDEMQGTLVDQGPRANTQNPIFLHYVTPTEPGNSGSPVFEAEGWRVVGLHHMGFVNGGGGLPKLGGKAGTSMSNEGIWIESIRAAVKETLSPGPTGGGRRKWWG